MRRIEPFAFALLSPRYLPPKDAGARRRSWPSDQPRLAPPCRSTGTSPVHRPEPGRPVDVVGSIRPVVFCDANVVGDGASHLWSCPGLRSRRWPMPGVHGALVSPDDRSRFPLLYDVWIGVVTGPRMKNGARPGPVTGRRVDGTGAHPGSGRELWSDGVHHRSRWTVDRMWAGTLGIITREPRWTS
jgi:hypothetical protein